MTLEIGKAIRHHRVAAGLSQEELSERMDTTRQYISDIERNNKVISVETLIKLAQALEVPAEDLFQAILVHSKLFTKSTQRPLGVA